jgi:hypothetical protein
MDHFVIGPFPPLHHSLKTNFYGLCWRKASEHARSIGRELAEGPTVFIPYDMSRDYPNPMELWPLVTEV